MVSLCALFALLVQLLQLDAYSRFQNPWQAPSAQSTPIFFCSRCGWGFIRNSYVSGGRLLDVGAHNPGAASGRPVQCPYGA